MTKIMNDLKIITKSEFLPEYSSDEKALFLFSYKIIIENTGGENFQLLSRHWDIEDSLGRKKVVDGEGIVGKKPIIKPGESFEYKSFCPLNTNFGYMKGFYTVKDEKGKLFKVSIPKFGLIPPSYIN